MQGEEAESANQSQIQPRQFRLSVQNVLRIINSFRYDILEINIIVQMLKIYIEI